MPVSLPKPYMKTVFLTLLLLTSFAIHAKDPCAYIAKVTPNNKQPEWQNYEHCATYQAGKLSITPKHLEKIAFLPSGLASFWTSGQYFYIKSNGDFLPVIRYDNGADPYQEGLVRSLVDSKIAYYNNHLERVIPPKYNWGWPFENGRALVCLECKLTAPDEHGHQRLTGGLWGYINTSGKEIIPVKYQQNKLPE